MAVGMARIPNAPNEYRRMDMQQILTSIQAGMDELKRRGISTGTADTAAAGTATALPPTPEGYAVVVVDGREVLMPYYLPL